MADLFTVRVYLPKEVIRIFIVNSLDKARETAVGIGKMGCTWKENGSETFYSPHTVEKVIIHMEE